MGYAADIIIRALDEAGVGNDIPGLVSWLMDNEPENRSMISSGSERQISGLSHTRRSSGANKIHHASCAGPAKGPLVTPNPTAWTKIARKDPPKPQVVSAQWIPKTPKPKQRRRVKRSDNDGTPSFLEEEPEASSSTGMIELDCVNFTWILDPKDSSMDQPKLSKPQVARLEEFLHTLMSGDSLA